MTFAYWAYMKHLAIGLVAALCAGEIFARSNSVGAAIDTYIQPYVRSGNLMGDVLVQRNGKVVFEKAYGFTDRERRVGNTNHTRFHIASMSMQFTAAAILRLADVGLIGLDDRVGDLVPAIDGANRISIRDLLTERSGLPDINALSDYNEILRHRQTPASLVLRIGGGRLLFEPGSRFLHEEHSAYNVLALIVERKTGLPFAAAVERLVFKPMGMPASGIDDDSEPRGSHMARGYAPEGASGLKLANPIHWSAKTGNGSAYATAADEARWVGELFHGDELSASSRNAVIDSSIPVGYGWFKSLDKRFSETAYYMNGRAPGFASFVLYLPNSRTTVVILSNVYSSATTTIGYDVAALSLGLPYKSFRVSDPAPGASELQTCTGSFLFGPDFYQVNAVLTSIVDGGELHLRWPSGEITSLIPVGRDRFIDRSYWVDVRIERNASGRPLMLFYDRFQGKATAPGR
ncbi:MAG TPA: serine hydrolase domain-containing protein [Bryobacteraceae bacterium]|nr:serine hydrolase domain-containing protein [Bryobacteraceae bacterium]